MIFRVVGTGFYFVKDPEEQMRTIGCELGCELE